MSAGVVLGAQATNPPAGPAGKASRTARGAGAKGGAAGAKAPGKGAAKASPKASPRTAPPELPIMFSGPAVAAKVGRAAERGPSANVGQTIVLAGKGFSRQTTVQLQGFSGLPFPILPDGEPTKTSMRVTIPEQAVTGELRLVDPALGASNAAKLQIVPSVDSLSAKAVAAGDHLLIDGHGFAYEAQVLFAGVKEAVVPAVVSPTRIDVVVPDGARTGAVTVVTSGGRSAPKPLAVARAGKAPANAPKTPSKTPPKVSSKTST